MSKHIAISRKLWIALHALSGVLCLLSIGASLYQRGLYGWVALFCIPAIVVLMLLIAINWMVRSIIANKNQ